MVDYIIEKDNAQDSWALLSTFDAVIGPVKEDLPSVLSDWIVTYNARNYQNDLLSVVAPFITASHGVNLTAFIHPETVRGKVIVDE